MRCNGIFLLIFVMTMSGLSLHSSGQNSLIFQINTTAILCGRPGGITLILGSLMGARMDLQVN